MPRPKISPRDSWLGIRVIWEPCQVDNIIGKCALFVFRKQRLPWLKLQKLLAVVANHQLLLYKLDIIPRRPLAVSDAFMVVRPQDFAADLISEWFEWPTAEAVYEGFTGMDACEVEPMRRLADYVLKQWHANPLPGWQPIHRGHMGVSFVRDLINNQSGEAACGEITAKALLLYNKPLAINEAMRDRDVIRRWGVHDMEPVRMFCLLDAEDIVQARLIMRYYRMYAWDYVLSQDLPF